MKKKKMLVIVDMINGFIKEGNLADKNISRIIPNVIKKIEDAIKNDYLIVAFRDCHKKNDIEFKTYPAHCIKGSTECELVDELKPYLKHMFVVDKNTTNGFNTRIMQSLLNYFAYEEIEVVGCCSDICVKDFTESVAKFRSINRPNFKIYVDENCIDTFSSPTHNADIINSLTINYFESLGITVRRKDKSAKIYNEDYNNDNKE